MEIVRKSITLYKENRDLFAHYLKLLYLPSAFTVIGIQLLDFFEGALAPLMLFLLLLLIIIPASIASLWISIAFLRVIANKYEGQEGKLPKETLHDATRLIIPVIVGSILSGLAVFGGLILLIIPGIVFSIWFAFTTTTIVLDGKRGVGALSYSKQLVKGRWVATLIRLALPAVLFAAASFFVQGLIDIPTGALLKQMDPQSIAAIFLSIVVGLFVTAVNILLTPLFSGAPTILYLELKKTPLKTV